MRRRSRRWRARAVAGAAPARGGCVRAHRWLDSTLAMHHEAGPSVQMMRVRFCLEAAEKPSYPAAYGILAMRMSTFLLLLSYVVWPRHMMVRRATSARGGVVGPALCLMGRRDGLREASLRCLGGLPPCPARVEPSPAGERDALPSGHSSPRVLDTPEQRATMTS